MGRQQVHGGYSTKQKHLEVDALALGKLDGCMRLAVIYKSEFCVIFMHGSGRKAASLTWERSEKDAIWMQVRLGQDG
jgi:hypothetical protein